MWMEKRLQIHGWVFRVATQRGRQRCGQRVPPLPAAVTKPGRKGMALSQDKTPRREPQSQQVQRFVEGMTSEDRMLVVLKRELYEGSWDEMVADLKARLEGRPYIFKLAHRIGDDLSRIVRLRAFEDECGVDLCAYVKLES